MRQFVPLIFLIVFFGILITANIYLTRRFTWYFDFKSTRFLYITFAAIILFMIGGMIPLMNAKSGLANLAYSAAAIVMGFMLYLLLSVMVVDVFGIFIKASPKTLGVVAISLAVLISGYGIWNATHKQIREVDIEMKGLSKEIKAALLTDIHIGHFWGVKTLQKVVDITNAQKPDVIFIAGDLFDGKIRLNKQSLEPLTKLNAPVYFVEGNHDGYSGAKEIKDNLRDIGVQVLENEVTHFSQTQIIGLNHMRADEESFNMHAPGVRSTIKSTLNELNIFPGKPTILLHHSPDGIQYASKHGIDLFLAGHTHNGQLFPFSFVVKMIYKFNKGLHDYKGTKIYVSQGVGTFGPPMRVGTISEITILNLNPE